MLENILEQNKAWADKVAQENPDFFNELAKGQAPEYLWIGCADSRVPACQVTGMKPGEMFVHRNVANLVIPTDLNSLSVMQYAVFNLGVKHVIVCGHYGCGGVHAAYSANDSGLVFNWLGHIKQTIRKHEAKISDIPESEKVDKLCEYNVMEQVSNVGYSTVLQAAWSEGKEVTVHGWIFGLDNGKISNLDVSISNNNELKALSSKLS